MKLLKLLAVCALLSLSLWAQTPSPSLSNTCAAGAMPEQGGTWGTTGLSCTNSQTIALGAGSIYIYNRLHGVTSSFEYVINGTPDTISVALYGCMKGGTCDLLETYTTVANSVRSPTTSKVYDYYKITPTGTGGTSPSVTINTTVTTARIGTPGLHFDGAGNATLDGSLGLGVALLTNGEKCAVGTAPSCTCTTAATIDPANGNRQKLTLTAGQTCALTFVQPTSNTVSIRLKVIQSSSGSYNGAISGCTWPGGTVPTITQAVEAKDLIVADLDGATASCVASQDIR